MQDHSFQWSPPARRRRLIASPSRAPRRLVVSPPRIGVEPTFHSRFECKYLVSPVALSRIREFLAPFMEPDEFAAVHPGYSYPVSSLYLDSPDLMLYQQTVGGEKNRFKLRVRTYSDVPATPAFFEVKWKVNSIVHKRRAGVNREQAERFLTSNHPADVAGLAPSSRDDLEYFSHLVRQTGARPVIRVKYRREAYQTRSNQPVRVTIDTDLMHAVTLGHELSHVKGRWVATQFRGVIVEIKFTNRFPRWINDFVRGLSLMQQPVPKYVMSLEQVLERGGETALALGGEMFGPRRRA